MLSFYLLVAITLVKMDNEVLTIQDILERVLLFAEKKCLISCSIVSKQWSPLANRLLWHSLDSQRPLLELLAPLQNRTAYDFVAQKVSHCHCLVHEVLQIIFDLNALDLWCLSL